MNVAALLSHDNDDDVYIVLLSYHDDDDDELLSHDDDVFLSHDDDDDDVLLSHHDDDDDVLLSHDNDDDVLLSHHDDDVLLSHDDDVLLSHDNDDDVLLSQWKYKQFTLRTYFSFVLMNYQVNLFEPANISGKILRTVPRFLGTVARSHVTSCEYSMTELFRVRWNIIGIADYLTSIANHLRI